MPLLPAAARGADAASGAQLVAAAARNGLTPAVLAQRLREDRTLWLDRCGVLFFADEVPAPPQDADPPAVVDAAVAWPTSIAPAEALTLHSRPGAQRTLLLDFDGDQVSGTGWNSTYGVATIDAPAFTLDADPSFSEAERVVIIEVWRRVAQDYAPFDVDVTTAQPEDPGVLTRSAATDQAFGTRVLITPEATTQSRCTCGGRAYIGVFDLAGSHDFYQPAWVYPQTLGQNAKYIADAASHEAGHTLGLSHDGTPTSGYSSGSGGWGPIMGAPYGQAVTQWSPGSYPGADNTEDDLAVIAANGAPMMGDDQAGTPTMLAATASATGLLGTADDVDRFSVSVAAGSLAVEATPFWPGPNLDLGLTITDPAGTVIATEAPAFDAAAPAASLRASLTVSVPAGTYTIALEGTGNGIAGSAGASDDGSLGWYSLAVRAQAPGSPSPSPSPSAPTPAASASTSGSPSPSGPPPTTPPTTPPPTTPPPTTPPPTSPPPTTQATPDPTPPPSTPDPAPTTWTGSP
ncbi:MAG TPA: hypothetical protein VF143_01135 [Candidatus Nanopelagicales bacterium]